jgi:Got1/Sft2-like family
MGPWQYLQHLTSGPRLPFTTAYFGSIALTIYFAVGVSNAFYFSLRPSVRLLPGNCSGCARSFFSISFDHFCNFHQVIAVDGQP